MKHWTQETAQERAERYLRENRTVSGGDGGNPPDKYDLVQLTGNKNDDLAAINALADQGYRFVANLPFNYVLMGGYKS